MCLSVFCVAHIPPRFLSKNDSYPQWQRAGQSGGPNTKAPLPRTPQSRAPCHVQSQTVVRSYLTVSLNSAESSF